MAKNLRLFIIGLLGVLFTYSCNSEGPTGVVDPTIPERPPVPQYPKLNLLDSTDVLFVDSALVPGDTFALRLRGVKGDSLLETLTITANEQPLDQTRLSINGNPSTTSTINLTGGERDNFTWDIQLVAQQDKRKVIYEFRLEDETGRSAVTDILINTNITPFTPPVINVLNDTIATILTEEKVLFDFVVEALGSPLVSMEIFQGAVLVEPNRIVFDGMQLPSNPLQLTDEDKRGFSKSIEVTGDTIAGIQAYTVILQDSLDNKYFQEISLNAIRRVEDVAGAILNKTMALDLDKGIELDYREEQMMNDKSRISEIRDIASIPGTWERRIAPTYGAELRLVKPDQNVVFEDIKGEDKVRTAWNAASNLTEMITEYDSTLVRGEIMKDSLVIDTVMVGVSLPLNVDDIYITQRENNYYMLKVIEVDDGSESYQFDIKY